MFGSGGNCARSYNVRVPALLGARLVPAYFEGLGFCGAVRTAKSGASALTQE